MADDDGNASSKRARVDDSASTSGSDTAASRKLFGGRSPFDADHKIRRQSGMFHVLVGVTGSVATIKARELVDEIRRLAPPDSVIIKIVATKSAIHFLRGLTFEHEIIYEDEDEWSMWTGRGDPVLHIELRKWADAMVIAPLDANTMAKLANGLCDNLLTSVVRAWDPTRPLWFAPAMNTLMWESPLTFQQRKTLRDLLSFKEIPPVEKELVCGDVGAGGMAPPRFIASIVAQAAKASRAVITDHSRH